MRFYNNSNQALSHNKNFSFFPSTSLLLLLSHHRSFCVSAFLFFLFFLSPAVVVVDDDDEEEEEISAMVHFLCVCLFADGKRVNNVQWEMISNHVMAIKMRFLINNGMYRC
jgi:hypothetical protein